MKPLLLIILLFSTISSHGGVYGDLEFGDSRKTVTTKLKNSELVTSTESDSIFGNLSLDGAFTCKQKLANLSYSLFFNWQENLLSAVTLHSENLEAAEYNTKLQKAWNDATTLLSGVYGLPNQENTFPSQFSHNKNGIMMSHVWDIDKKTIVMLGTGKREDQYFLAIRYAKK